MDNRVKALLEPRAFAKGRKASTKKETEETASGSAQTTQTNALGLSNHQKPAVSSRPVPNYDPRQLLNPRGARNSTKVQKPNPYMNAVGPASDSRLNLSDTKTESPPPGLYHQTSGSRSMIENLYGVEKRSERPVKRAKLETNADENKDRAKGKSGRTYHSSGIVGEYMRPNSDDQNLAVDHSKIVDLTNLEDLDDSDDDLKVLKSRNISNEQVVCFGRIQANVQAHAVPQPRIMKDLYGDTGQWSLIRCTAQRTPSKNTVIEVKDPFDFIFGRVEVDLANVFAPLLDGLKKFNLDIIINPRKRKPGDNPHQSCSEILVATVNLYGRRIDVEKVGRILGQRNIWLRQPLSVPNGYEIVNPHIDRFRKVVPQIRPSNRHQPYGESRTVEEATEAVSRLFDHYANTAKPLDETEPTLIIATPLLPHQKQALTFMLQQEQARTYGETEVENSSLWRKRRKANGLVYYEEIVSGITSKEEPEQVYGGLLADVMGLGKTIEALALIAHTMEDSRNFGNQPLVRADASESFVVAQSKATLIVAPVSTVKNWEDQIREHVNLDALKFYTYHGSHREKDPQKLAQYDIVISTYSTIAAECSAKSLGDSPIKAIRWFRIILDEAHTIRESRASQSQAMYSLLAQRRWCLTGTPIQNRLDDLGSLTRFLRLYPYDTTMRFNQYVRSPAQSGDDNYLKALRVFIDSFTLRRLKDRVDLPVRNDYIEGLDFSAAERRLHDFFKDRASIQLKEMAVEQKERSVSQHHVLRAIMTLRLICDHGRELLKEDDLEAFKGNSEADAIDVDADASQDLPAITSRTAYETLALLAEADLDLCKQCDKKIGGDSPRVETENTEDIRGYMLSCYDLFCSDCFEYHKGVIDDMVGGEKLECPMCQMNIPAQYIAIPKTTAELLDWAPEETLNESSEVYKKGTYTGPSTKVKALLDDLAEIRQQSEELRLNGESPIKSVVFSEFTSYLDLIERALHDHGFGDCFVRIDGSMSLNKRKVVLDSLSQDDHITILLASIKAAGQGLNLTAASRAFIMEPMWNPAAEIQAVDRIHRIGQTRSVVIKRYRMNNSIEGKIVELQRRKQALADISMNRNHKQLSAKETREKHMKDILLLFK